LLLFAAALLSFPGVSMGQTSTPHFQFKNRTGENYAILIRTAKINGVDLSLGDEVGVFTSGGLCVGAVVVTQPTTLGLTAWRDDPQTPGVMDGYLDGEAMSFRFWHAGTQLETNATAIYRLGNGTFNFGPYAEVDLSVTFNFPPQLAKLDSIRFNEDTSYELPLDTIVNDANHADSTLEWQVVYEGNNLAVTLTNNHLLRLTPAPNWFGTDHCTLIVHDPAGVGDTAKVRIIVAAVQDRPTAAVLVEPIQGVRLNSRNPVLRWQAAIDPDGDKLRYTVIYGISPTLAAPNDTIRTEATSARIPVLLSTNRLYYWRVAVNDGATPAVLSAIESFFIEPNAVAVAERAAAPLNFALEQNYPNPFSLHSGLATTRIRFALPKPAIVSVRIYNNLGQLVRDLFQGEQPTGLHQIFWDGLNDRGQKAGSGLYWLRLQSNDFVATRKMLLVP
jgi:hypothetical protein